MAGANEARSSPSWDRQMERWWRQERRRSDAYYYKRRQQQLGRPPMRVARRPRGEEQ